jgi:hypothetical protein
LDSCEIGVSFGPAGFAGAGSGAGSGIGAVVSSGEAESDAATTSRVAVSLEDTVSSGGVSSLSGAASDAGTDAPSDAAPAVPADLISAVDDSVSTSDTPTTPVVGTDTLICPRAVV